MLLFDIDFSVIPLLVRFLNVIIGFNNLCVPKSLMTYSLILYGVVMNRFM